MEYATLGNTGLLVSKLCFGTMTFGDGRGLFKGISAVGKGVVLSTLRHAADMDYRAVVVADGCSDKDPEVQRVLMEKIFPAQARVAMVEECIGAIP
jgi:aryl-alcohol dehydrogenase-like predicted oxidoreductase